MHYYKRNLGDYAKKAGRLSMMQHGAYTLLIDACYDREQFPTMEEAIEWTWASTKEEEEAVRFVLKRFFILKDNVYVQKRIEEEIQEFHRKAETNKRIAVERETKRKNIDTVRVDSDNEPSPNHKPRTINQEPRTKNHKPCNSTLNPKNLPAAVAPDEKNDVEKKNGPETELQATCRATWKSYSDAYFERYKTPPVRNAETNSAIKGFCNKLPHHEAPLIAAYFVSHNDQFYIKKQHDVTLMRKDASGLRTQWATNTEVTTGKAIKQENTAGNRDAINGAIQLLRSRNGSA